MYFKFNSGKLPRNLAYSLVGALLFASFLFLLMNNAAIVRILPVYWSLLLPLIVIAIFTTFFFFLFSNIFFGNPTPISMIYKEDDAEIVFDMQGPGYKPFKETLKFEAIEEVFFEIIKQGKEQDKFMLSFCKKNEEVIEAEITELKDFIKIYSCLKGKNDFEVEALNFCEHYEEIFAKYNQSGKFEFMIEHPAVAWSIIYAGVIVFVAIIFTQDIWSKYIIW